MNHYNVSLITQEKHIKIFIFNITRKKCICSRVLGEKGSPGLERQLMGFLTLINRPVVEKCSLYQSGEGDPFLEKLLAKVEKKLSRRGVKVVGADQLSHHQICVIESSLFHALKMHEELLLGAEPTEEDKEKACNLVEQVFNAKDTPADWRFHAKNAFLFLTTAAFLSWGDLPEKPLLLGALFLFCIFLYLVRHPFPGVLHFLRDWGFSLLTTVLWTATVYAILRKGVPQRFYATQLAALRERVLKAFYNLSKKIPRLFPRLWQNWWKKVAELRNRHFRFPLPQKNSPRPEYLPFPQWPEPAERPKAQVKPFSTQQALQEIFGHLKREGERKGVAEQVRVQIEGRSTPIPAKLPEKAVARSAPAGAGIVPRGSGDIFVSVRKLGGGEKSHTPVKQLSEETLAGARQVIADLPELSGKTSSKQLFRLWRLLRYIPK